MKLWLSFVLALCLGLPTVEAQERKPDKKDAKTESKEESSEADPLASAIPEKMPMKGIKIPYYGPDGKTLQMTFDAELATKVSDTNIEMKNLKIDVYGDDNKKFLIELPTSVFNLETRILSGKDHIRITREDFEITGDALEFETKTRFGTVLGNVKMIILSTENIENP